MRCPPIIRGKQQTERGKKQAKIKQISNMEKYNMSGYAIQYDGTLNKLQSVQGVTLAKAKYLLPMWLKSCDQVIITKAQMEAFKTEAV